MVPHVEFVVQEVSQIGAARRHAAMLTQQLGFDEVAAGRVAIIVTELGNNLVRHARDGRLLLNAAREEGRPFVEIVSLDRGPGMADTERCLKDGYSTGGTSGSGLGGVRRLSCDFDIFSKPDVGTVVLSRVMAGSPPAARTTHATALELAGICVAAPGESVSGDSWASCERDQRGGLIVADGLGHGPEAAIAADGAIGVFLRHPGLAPAELLGKAHESLRGTRGAAVAVVAFDAIDNRLTICGAGNIVGRLISGTEDRSLMTQHGTVGLQVHRWQPMHYDWREHAVLVVHSDGIATRWNLQDVPRLLHCSAAVIAAWILHLHCRGRDDATVVVMRRR
ncbi:MAG TPA: SpoIIE family protein phosphatase [Rubrivivax sp.]